MEFDYEIITQEKDVPRVIETLRGGNIFACDTETTGLDFKTDRIVGISIANDKKAFYITKEALKPFATELSKWTTNPNTLFIGHNFQFDLHFFRKLGVEFTRIADTMLAAFMINENMSIGLKPCAEHYLRLEEELPSFKDMQKECFEIAKQDYKIALKEYRKNNPAGGTPLFPNDAPPVLRWNAAKEVTAEDIPLDTFGRYGALDARLTYDLWQKFLFFLEEQKVLDIFWELEMPFVPLLCEMEESGIGIDVPQMNVLREKYEKIKEEKLNTFLKIAGDVNPNSDPQLCNYLYTVRKFPVTIHTQKGNPSTDALALQRIEPKDSTGAVTALLEYRRYDKVLNTYILPFLELAKGQTINPPRIFGSYNQTGTVTGRLSADEPNLQNIPARHETGTEIRKVFIAKDGYDLIDADYSQLELRILAHYANDEAYIQLFKDGGDPHQLTADLCKITRRIGKTINFAWVYGAGPRKLCDTIEKEGNPRPMLEEAKQWMNSFETKRPALVDWKNKVIVYAKKLGYVRTIAGRRRHLQELRSSDMSVRGRAERQAVNTIIQGSAGDIIKYAMIQINRELKEKNINAKILVQVHDEIVLESAKECTSIVCEIVERQMKEAGTHFGLKTPLVAEAHVGASWGDAKG